jgi:hypothetical protein
LVDVYFYKSRYSASVEQFTPLYPNQAIDRKEPKKIEKKEVTPKPKSKSKPNKQSFIEDEAEISGDDDFISSDEDESFLEEMIDSQPDFVVSDDIPGTPVTPNRMRSIYLQSLNSQVSPEKFAKPLRKDRPNKYKMVYQFGRPDASPATSASEASSSSPSPEKEKEKKEEQEEETQPVLST